MVALCDEKQFESPLIKRYASEEMSCIFSAQNKFSTWRKLWIALAEAEASLGLPITGEQIDELKRHQEEIDFSLADAYEKKLHHDVMAHIHTYGDLCPNARPIIHLGATSCYVTDNTETLQMQEGLTLLLKKLNQVIQQLSLFAKTHADLPTLAFTHFQPAQLTTVGKRACLWIQDLLFDQDELENRKKTLLFLGVKGATGTQASFLSLFDGDAAKVKELDHLVAKKMGFNKTLPISGQTYSRKQDLFILQALAQVGVSCHKFATDLRLLAHLKEVQEPFGKHQVGSSAMPYKRNPILSERVCALSRFLIALSENPAYTAATQWLERSLDDSANRRLSIPEAFLTADSILELMIKITKDLQVNKEKISRNIKEELPLIATENYMMEAVMKGGDRQAIHEEIRQKTQAGQKNVVEPKEPIEYVGLAPTQVREFLQEVSR